MPLPVPPPKPKNEDVTGFLYRTNLKDFQQKAILYGLATVAAAAVCFMARDAVSWKMAVLLIGAPGLEAAKNLRRWWAWSQEQPPKPDRLHPDRAREIEQQTVQIMADAVKSRAWFTRGLVIAVAVPSILELVAGIEHAVSAASVDPVAIRAGAWWRLLGGTYLHGSYYHFAGNMGALLVYGSILESKTSRLRLPLVYLLSCLGGSVASVLIPPDVPSIGASGGIVGVIAYLFVFSRRQEVKFPAAFRGATASVFVGLITAGALGFWYIDNPGHAGGAIAGLVVAGLVVDTARTWGDDIPLPLLDLLGWVAAAILAAGSVVTTIALFA